MEGIGNEVDIGGNFQRVNQDIHEVAQSCGRDPDSIRLVVVTKGHQPIAVKRVIEAGATIVGENYVEEALDKMELLPDAERVEWHMIGHIQSRKAPQVCAAFHTVHSLDSVKLALRLDRYARKYQRSLPVLLECNLSGEATKYGWSAWDERQWSDLLAAVSEILALDNLDVCGLMTMPPYSEDPETSRPIFKRLRKLQGYLRDHFPDTGWGELSMGMSQDYRIAIEEGATILRIGTEIMGPRMA